MGDFEDLSDQLQKILKKGTHPSRESPGRQRTATPGEGGQGSDAPSGMRDLDVLLHKLFKTGARPSATLDELTRQGPRGVLVLNPGHVRALITKAIEDATAGSEPGQTLGQGPHALLIMDRDWLTAEIAAVKEILTTRAQATAAEHLHALELSQSASDKRALQESQERLRLQHEMAAEQVKLQAKLLEVQAQEAESRAQSQQLTQRVETFRQKLLEAERQKNEAVAKSEGDLAAMREALEGSLHALQIDYRGALEALRKEGAAREDAEQTSAARCRALEAQVQSLQARESEALASGKRATTALQDLRVQSQGAQTQATEALAEAQRKLREASAREAEAEQRFQAHAQELQDQFLATEREKSQTHARLEALQERFEEVQAGEREAKTQADRTEVEIRRLQEQLLSLEREKGAAVVAAEQRAREMATSEAAAASAALEARVREFQAREASAQANTERLVAELQELRQRHPSVGSDEMEGLLTRFKADLTLELSRRENPSGRTSPAVGNLPRAIISRQVDRTLDEPLQSNLDDQSFATRQSGPSRRLSKARERLQSIQKHEPQKPEEESKK